MNGTRLSKCLIATDEAGYGPQLGPLVIAATCWELADTIDSSTAFVRIANGFEIPSLGRIRIGDSKKLFSAGKANGLQSLESAIVGVAACVSAQPVKELSQWLELLSPSAVEVLAAVPWFAEITGGFPCELPLMDDWDHIASSVRQVFRTDQVALRSATASIIPARTFNQRCVEAGNKASMLSEQTIQLAMRSIDQYSLNDVEVFSDKHGGRAFYGGMLQHFFPDGQLTIEVEGRQTSCYRIRFPEREIRWHFTAKGDAFAPVALASMIAKYTRERLMGLLNAFWQSRVQNLAPTAGYPGDATRFLEQINDAVITAKISIQDLVRSR